MLLKSVKSVNARFLISSLPPRSNALEGGWWSWNVINDLQRRLNACEGVSESTTLILDR